VPGCLAGRAVRARVAPLAGGPVRPPGVCARAGGPPAMGRARMGPRRQRRGWRACTAARRRDAVRQPVRMPSGHRRSDGYRGVPRGHGHGRQRHPGRGEHAAQSAVAGGGVVMEP
jgi:hypothetical protein